MAESNQIDTILIERIREGESDALTRLAFSGQFPRILGLFGGDPLHSLQPLLKLKSVPFELVPSMGRDLNGHAKE